MVSFSRIQQDLTGFKNLSGLMYHFKFRNTTTGFKIQNSLPADNEFAGAGFKRFQYKPILQITITEKPRLQLRTVSGV